MEHHLQHREFPRRFLPADIDLGSWDAIAQQFARLRDADIAARDALEAWLLDLSELQAAIGEEYTIRYIRMTCHTDDPDLERAYLDYVEHIMPRCEPEYFELSRKYLASPARASMPPERYFVYDRARETEVAIFRAENIPLQTEDEVLAQHYQKACGEQTVEFDGREQTMPQMARYLEETDRASRHAAWAAATARQLADRGPMEDIFDKMLALRDRMARNAGFPGFVEYQFRRLGRFDYTPADCLEFHRTVEKLVTPLRRRLRERRRTQLGIGRLAPWDLQVDALGLPPLRPFTDGAQLADGVARIFSAVDPSFEADFGILQGRQLLDLESRKGKAPGGYQSTLDEARLPFIFMNAAGRNQDVFTLVHEGGHAFHALATRAEPLTAYRSAPIEFCEVASMGMEMMACERLGAFYGPEDAARARAQHLEDIAVMLPWIARVDAMQHWMYANPGHTRAQREQMWLELGARFEEDLDWGELAEWRGCSWIAKLHFFCVPLYYVEYAIAQLGALQLWARFLKDPEAAVSGYRAGIALGNSQPLPRLFEAAGIRFAFDEATVAPLVERLAGALAAD
jgi:oligoendopeptidase F